MASGNLTVNIKCEHRWWLPLAVEIAFVLLYFDLIPEAPSDEHWGGKISPMERVVKWIVKHGMIIEVSP